MKRTQIKRRKRRPPKRLPADQPPPPRPQPGPEQLPFQGIGQTDQQVRAMYDERARRTTAAIAASGSVNLGVPAPILATMSVTEPPDRMEATITMVAIDTRSADFHELKITLNEILNELRRSNIIESETRDVIRAEIRAGLALITAPKADRSLIDRLLKQPLIFIAGGAAGAVVGATANAALALLGKLTGLW